MYLLDFTPHSTWQFREHSQEETMLPTAWGGCLQPSTLAGFEFHSVWDLSGTSPTISARRWTVQPSRSLQGADRAAKHRTHCPLF